MKETGKLITRYRKKYGMTSSAFAEQLGVSKQFLGQVENGKRGPGVELIKKLVDKTGLDFDYWIGEEEYITSRKQFEKLDNLVNTLIDNDLIENEEDIFNSAYAKAFKTAVLADVRHKLELKKLENKKRAK